MKPTHILVTIDDWNTFKDDGYKSIDGTWIENHSPHVDLSEEGINKAAGDYENTLSSESFNKDVQFGGRWGYRQCAKDLLNTKP